MVGERFGQIQRFPTEANVELSPSFKDFFKLSTFILKRLLIKK